eukprot:12424667-Karenia_brevis.AAC.1
MRNRTLEEMHRVTGTFRGEAERITDNLMEVMEEIRDRHANDVAPQRRGQDQPEPRRVPSHVVAAIESVSTRGRWAPAPAPAPAIGDRPPQPPSPPNRPSSQRQQRSPIEQLTQRIDSALVTQRPRRGGRSQSRAAGRG